MTDPLGGANYGTTTTTSPGGPGTPPPPPSRGPALGTSAWARSYTSRQSVRERYRNADSGLVVPLRDRAFDFRSQFAQTGDARLDTVLDYFLSEDERADLVGSTRGGSGKKTVAGWLEFWRKATPETVSAYQDRLWESGYFPPAVYKNPELLQRGVYDQATQAAMTQLFKDGVMAHDLTLSELMRNRKNQIDQAGGLEAWLGLADGDRQEETIEVTAPEDIRQTGEQAAREMLGRKDEGFAESLVGGYQAQEASFQQARIDDQAAGGGGQITSPPSLGAYAVEQLEAQQPTEVDSYATLGAFNELLRMLGMAG